MLTLVLPADLTEEQVRAEVRRIQSSAGFATAPSLRQLLEWTVEKTLNGQSADIKETTLAIEVFGRKTSFDPQTDPIVRVQARKLRERISAWYDTNGAHDDVLIEYVRGSYVPRFGLRNGALKRQRSIAVLPFTNLGETAHLEYLSSGLTEEINYSLSRVHGLRVVARTSALLLQNTTGDVHSVGQQLNADLLIRGTIRESAGRIRVTAQLIDCDDGYQLWAERWERSTADLFELQDEIASSIAHSLRSEALKRTATPPAQDREAYQLFVKGRYYWTQRTEHGFRRAIEHYEAAIARDPNFARAFAALAETYILIAAHHLEKPAECLQRATRYAIRALAIDPDLSAAHSARAGTLLFYERKRDEAEREYRSALSLDPGYAYAWHALSVFGCFVKPFSGQAITAIEQAQRLDPLAPAVVSDVAVAYYMSGEFERAVELAHAALDLHPTFSRTYVFLGRAQAALGRYKDAIETCLQARPLFTGRAFLGQLLATLGYSYGRLGQTEDARRVLAELTEISARHFVAFIDRAVIHTGLGEDSSAIELLERANRDREFWVISIGTEPIFRSLHEHPRFRSLTDQLFLR